MKKKPLLSKEECAVCEQIAKYDNFSGRRASALLLLNKRDIIQREVGAQTGLTRGQVKYALERFRKSGLAMFPEDILNQAKSTLDSQEDRGEKVDESTQATETTIEEEQSSEGESKFCQNYSSS